MPSNSTPASATPSEESETPKQKRRRRRWLWRGAAALGVIVILLIAAFGALQTPMGKRWLADRLNAMLDKPGMQVHVEGVSGTVPTHFTVTRVTVSDDEGVWLEANDLSLGWRVLPLFRKTVRVHKLTAERVAVLRAPVPIKKDEPADPDKAPLTGRGVLLLLQSLPVVQVPALDIARLELAEGLLPRATALQVAGSLDTDSALTRTLHVDIAGLDGEGLSTNLDLTIHPATTQAKLALTLEEPAGGVLGLLAKLPDDQPVVVDVNADGDLNALPATVRLTSGETALLDTDGTLALLDEVRADLTGTSSVPSAMRPEKAGSLLAEPMRFTFKAGLNEDRSSAEAKADVDGAGLHVTLGAAYALDAKSVDAHVDISAADASVYSDIAGQPLTGSATVKAEVSGPLDALTLALAIDAPQLTRSETELDGLVMNLSGSLVKTDSGIGADIQGEGSLRALRDPSLPELATPFAEWTVTASTADDGNLCISLPLTFSAIGGTVTVVTTGDDEFKQGNFSVAAHLPEVQSLAVLAGVDGSGAFDLDAEGTYAREEPRVDVAVTAKGSGLTGFHEAVAAVVGSAFDLKAQVTLADDRVNAPEFTLASDNLDVTANANYGLKTKSAEAAFTVDMPRLDTLSSLAKRPLAGALHAEGRVLKTPDEMTADVKGNVDGLTVDARNFDGFTFDLSTQGPPETVEGHANIALWDAVSRFETKAAFARDGETFSVPEFALDGPGVHAKGSASVPAERAAATGSLTVDASDLNELGVFLGIDLSGSADVEASLTAEGGQQRLLAKASVSALRAPGITVESAALNASLAQPFSAPAGTGNLTVANLSAGENRVDAIRATLKGTGSSVTIDATASGPAPVVFDLANTTTVAFSDAGQTIEIAALSGTVEDIALGLQNPTTVRLRDGLVDAEPLTLTVDDGTVTAGGTYGPNGVNLELTVADLPLALASRFGGPPLAGLLRADVALTGALSSPALEIDAAATGVRALDDGADSDEDETIDGTVNAQIQNGGLSASLRASGMSAEPTTAEVAIPLTFSLSPFAFRIEKNAPLSGVVALHVDTGKAGDIVLPSTQTMSGLLNGDLSIAGTLATPQLNGTVTMTDGAYENVDTGTVLSDIQLDAQLEGQKLILRGLDVQDGEGGSVHVEGDASLAPEITFAFDASLDTANLVRLDIAEAVVDGDVSVKGTQAGAEVKGAVTASPVHVTIPGSTGPDVPTLDVRTAGVEEKSPEAEVDVDTPPAYPVDVDVTVTMPDEVYVEGRGLKSQWGGLVTVKGQASDPIVGGNLKIVEGSLDFMSKSFQLVNCSITLDGPLPLDPLVDMTAQREQRDLVARLRVIGPVSAPQVRLESEPPLPPDEILAYILFGRPLDDLGPAQALQVARAARALSGSNGKSAFNVTGSVQQALGLDSLNFDASGGLGAASVGVGKQFSDRIYVEVNQGLGETGGGVSAKMDVTDDITVEATSSAGGGGGAAIKYKRDY